MVCASLDRGSVTLIEGSERRVRPLGRGTIVMKLDRYDPPAEVQLPDLRPGDTVRVGPSSGFADRRDVAYGVQVTGGIPHRFGRFPDLAHTFLPGLALHTGTGTAQIRKIIDAGVTVYPVDLDLVGLDVDQYLARFSA